MLPKRVQIAKAMKVSGNASRRFLLRDQWPGSDLLSLMSSIQETPVAAVLPSVWEYTDYRAWLNDVFQVRKSTHKWYSYGVLAQRAGFKTRAFLFRVMRGDRGLSAAGAEKLVDALDLGPREREYFLALVEYNQARKDDAREIAWSKVQHALVRSRNASAPRLLMGVHREVIAGWSHLAIRSLIELRPDSGDWEALGKRLRPKRSRSSVRRSIALLEKGGLIEQRPDGRWYATDKSLATPPELAMPAVRKFHRGCLRLASASLEKFPQNRRNITGVMLGISETTYGLVCEKINALQAEILALAEADCHADRVYQITFAAFPLSEVEERESPP